MKFLYFIALGVFGVSFLSYAFFIFRMMLRLPFRSWFPFGIWRLSTLRNILGEQYHAIMRPIYWNGAISIVFGLVVVVLSNLQKSALTQTGGM